MRICTLDVEKVFSFLNPDDYIDSLDLIFKEDFIWQEINSNNHRYPVLLRLCILQHYFDFTGEDLFYSIEDRNSFLEFLHIRKKNDIPDISLYIYFKKKVIEHNFYYTFFNDLDRTLMEQGIKVHRGRVRNPLITRIGEENWQGISKFDGNFASEVYYPGIPYPIKLRNNHSDMEIFREVLIDKVYYVSLDFNPRFILDCGANIGLSSIYFKKLFPDSFIVAVEPDSMNYALAEHNLSYYYPSISCIRAAVWHTNARVMIHNPEGASWGFMVRECNTNDKNGIDTVTLSEILKRYDRESIDILKMDIEGAESELFSENFEAWLPKCKVILIELHDDIKEGCSRSFFNALSNYDFSISIKNDLVYCIRKKG